VAKLLENYDDLRVADLAEVIHDLSPQRRAEVAAALDDDKLADILEELPEDDQVEILAGLDTERAADVLEAMQPDDAADLLAELSTDRQEQLLQLMEPDEAAPLRRLLTYDEKTAGGLMTTEPVILGPEATIAEALAVVRREELAPALASTVFVCRPPLETPTGRFIGVVHIQRLLREPPHSSVGSVVDRGIEPMQLDVLGLVGRKPVDADDHAVARLDLALPAKGRLLDLLLDPAGLDRGNRPAEVVDPLDQLGRPLLELVGEGLDVPGAAERIRGVGRPRLVHEHLLRPEGEGRRALGGERERLVEGVRVQ